MNHGYEIRGIKDDVGTVTIRGAVKSGSTAATLGRTWPFFGSYAGLEGFQETDANTGVASTVSRVNAAEFGVKTTA